MVLTHMTWGLGSATSLLPPLTCINLLLASRKLVRCLYLGQHDTWYGCLGRNLSCSLTLLLSARHYVSKSFPASGVVNAMTVWILHAGGKVSRDAGPVKGGTSVIAFVDDPTGYKWEIIGRTRDIPDPIAQVPFSSYAMVSSFHSFAAMQP